MLSIDFKSLKIESKNYEQNSFQIHSFWTNFLNSLVKRPTLQEVKTQPLSDIILATGGNFPIKRLLVTHCQTFFSFIGIQFLLSSSPDLQNIDFIRRTLVFNKMTFWSELIRNPSPIGGSSGIFWTQCINVFSILS